MAAVIGVGHIALVTRDFERFASFYVQAFGAEVSPRSDNDRRAGLGFVHIGDRAALHVFERREGALGGIDDDRPTQPFARGRIDHFSLEVSGVEDFAAIRRRLIDLGASDGSVADFGPLVSLFFQDPDGLQMELSLSKTADWDPPFEVQPFTPRRPG